MSSSLSTLHCQLSTGVKGALAVVVETSGSTPQKAGARALFFSDGRVAGTLGGGCMEAEARRRAMAAMRRAGEARGDEDDAAPDHATGIASIEDVAGDSSGTDAFTFTLRLDDDYGWDDGLICGGAATVLIDPEPSRHGAVMTRLSEAMRDRTPSVLATVVESRTGSASGDESEEASILPLPVGATALMLPDGETVGDAIPPPLLASIRIAAAELFERPWGESRIAALPEGRVLLEGFAPPPVALILGAGHIGEALARLCAQLDFEVAVLDDRPSLVSVERFPTAARRMADGIVEGLRRFPIHRDCYVVIVTRGHRHDEEALREVIGSPAGYIGMIGSRRKVRIIFRDLLEEGWATVEQLRRVRSPIGLDIGASSVQEIALSIAAEMAWVRARIRAGADPAALVPDEETVHPMSARRGPIIADPS